MKRSLGLGLFHSARKLASAKNAVKWRTRKPTSLERAVEIISIMIMIIIIIITITIITKTITLIPTLD